jgi:hypothetical protein
LTGCKFFVLKIGELRAKTQYEGPIILLADGNASHSPALVIAYAWPQRIIVLNPVAYSVS